MDIFEDKQRSTYGVKIQCQLTTSSIIKQKLVALHDLGDS